MTAISASICVFVQRCTMVMIRRMDMEGLFVKSMTGVEFVFSAA